jgi:hypothetical protein
MMLVITCNVTAIYVCAHTAYRYYNTIQHRTVVTINSVISWYFNNMISEWLYYILMYHYCYSNLYYNRLNTVIISGYN